MTALRHNQIPAVILDESRYIADFYRSALQFDSAVEGVDALATTAILAQEPKIMKSCA